MTISEETLMAFADGELDAAGCARVERAMREDPSIAARVARHRALRARLQKAFAPALDEPPPERLRAAAMRGGPKVVSLADARAALVRNTETLQPLPPSAAPPARAGWRPLGTLAASLLLGLGLGYGVFRQSGLPVTRGESGALLASGVLRRALSEQLAAGQPADAAVEVGLSYRSRSGSYCRSFVLRGAAAPAGIACHRGGSWRIEALAARVPGEAGTYRPAATALPPALLKLVEDDIDGETLDAVAEARARHDGWQRAP